MDPPETTEGSVCAFAASAGVTRGTKVTIWHAHLNYTVLYKDSILKTARSPMFGRHKSINYTFLSLVKWYNKLYDMNNLLFLLNNIACLHDNISK